MYTQKKVMSTEPRQGPTGSRRQVTEVRREIPHSKASTHLLGGSLQTDGLSAGKNGLGGRAASQACAAAGGGQGWGRRGSQEFRGVGRSMTMGGFTGW